MQTPAERVQEQIDKMTRGFLLMEKDKPELRQMLAGAIVTALQTLKNFQEVERLTRNIERLN
jgi:hypothetical protein